MVSGPHMLVHPQVVDAEVVQYGCLEVAVANTSAELERLLMMWLRVVVIATGGQDSADVIVAIGNDRRAVQLATEGKGLLRRLQCIGQGAQHGWHLGGAG